MPAGGVPGFFGENKRNRRPVGLDMTFVYDTSGSMGNVNSFIRSLSTAQRIELALRDQVVGIEQPNRYSQSRMDSELVFASGRWVEGSQILSGINNWSNPSSTNIGTGNDIEDVTGSAAAIAVNNRGYRDGIQRIILSFSDEQGGANLDTSNAAITALTSPTTGQIFIGASGAILTISPAPPDAPVGAQWEPFGLVYTTQATGVAIYRNTSTNAVQYANVPIADTQWEATSFSSGLGTGVFFDVTGPLISSNQGTGSSNYQRVNTPRLAYLTGGAIYDVNKMLSTASLDAFGTSIGTVLGSLLYELLS